MLLPTLLVGVKLNPRTGLWSATKHKAVCPKECYLPAWVFCSHSGIFILCSLALKSDQAGWPNNNTCQLVPPAFDIRWIFFTTSISSLGCYQPLNKINKNKPHPGNLFILCYHLILILMWKILGQKPSVKFNTKDCYFSPILFSMIALYFLFQL